MMARLKLDDILQKALDLQPLSRREIEALLQLEDRDQWAQVFQTACKLRSRFFQNKIFLYGFIYFSTWCRNECTFCFYRKSNIQSRRYRKSDDEVLAAADKLAESGVHLIDLTLGEDPFYYHGREGFGPLVRLVGKVKELTGLPIMISPGVVPGEILDQLTEAGADWFACYQETHNRSLFSRLRLKQSYDRRFSSKGLALRSGMLVEEGILAGVGETIPDLACSLEEMGLLGAQQVRVMSFVPQPGTPMDHWSTPDRWRELKLIALMRLLYPERLIPASLDVDGVSGLQARIRAGANVVTSLIPPEAGLAGVAQCTKDIREGFRTVEGVTPYLEQLGLEAASADEYRDWVNKEKEKLGRMSGEKGILL